MDALSALRTETAISHKINNQEVAELVAA